MRLTWTPAPGRRSTGSKTMHVRSRLYLVALAVSMPAACGPGESALFVTIDSRGMVRGVDHFVLWAKNDGQTAGPHNAAPPSVPFDLPPPQTIQLRFDKSRRGPVEVTVHAVDRDGTQL